VDGWDRNVPRYLNTTHDLLRLSHVVVEMVKEKFKTLMLHVLTSLIFVNRLTTKVLIKL